MEINLHVHTNETPDNCEVKSVIVENRNAEPHAPRSIEQAAMDLLVRQNYSFAATGDATITATDITGATAQITTADLHGDFIVGKDYYIYASTETGKSSYAVSPNKDFDPGHIVGGFHYGKNRRSNCDLQPIGTDGKERGAGWESNVYDGILPHSIWTLTRRPKCAPEGMVRLPSGVWVDIYQASDDGSGGLVSAHSAMPLTRKSWYEFNELAIAKGKRLLSYSEWCAMALGSPQGLDDSNENAWSAEDNNGKRKTGYVTNAVSSIGCRDAVGNVWEWLDTLTNDPDGGDWRWWDKMPGYGQLFMAGSTGIAALFAGGGWFSGVQAGARAVSLYDYPWNVNTALGARCACDGL